jgi:uncharacterized Zn-finger protein
MLNPSLAANETLFLALYATLSKKDIPQLSPTGAACLYLTPCHALTKRSIIMKHTDLQARNNSSIAGQEVRLDGEHLRCDTGSEAIDLPRVLLDLPELSRVSNLLGSWGSLNSLCHSSSGSNGCFDADRAAFSALRFVCHAVILVCSRASERW